MAGVGVSSRRRTKVGLFPGTFDPVHLGHVAIARAAIAAGGLDEVWLLVDAEPAYKSNVLSFQHRIAMAGLATQPLPVVKVETAVISHNFQGFQSFTQQYSALDFVFVMGVDVLARLDTWDDVQSVVENTTFMVADRPEAGVGLVEALRRRLGPWGLSLQVQLFAVSEYTGASSTRVRQQLSDRGRSEFLSPSVNEYIERHHLYR